jgi:transposase
MGNNEQPPPGDWREWRRLRAVQLRQDDWTQQAIADALGASKGSVSRWLAVAHSHGDQALRARPRIGTPSRLRDAQKALLPDYLWHGAEAYGFRGDVWTCARVAQVIQEEFGVSYHPGHVSRLLKELQWTPQMPITRAVQRDEAAIQRWRDEVWPTLRRRARRQGRTVVFVDESGFYLLPGVVKTYGPKGQTPVTDEWQTHDHLSIMGGLTPEGQVYTLVRQESLTGLESIAFLEHLGRQIKGPTLVIWDGSPIHRRAAVKEYIESIGAEGLQVEALPAYAPDLNPVEWLWQQVKHQEMPNLACHDLEELHEEFHLAIGRIRGKPYLIPSFFEGAALAL